MKETLIVVATLVVMWTVIGWVFGIWIAWAIWGRFKERDHGRRDNRD